MARIVILRLGALGDILHALPAVHALAAADPGLELTWAVEPRWTPLLEGSPILHRVLTFNPRVPSEWPRLRGFDRAIDFQGLYKTAVPAAFARIPRRSGFTASACREPFASLFYSERLTPRSAHVVEQNAQLAGVAPAPVWLPPGQAEGLLPDPPFVLAAPFAGWVSKQWPLESYAALAALLPAPLVLNVAPADASRVAGIPNVRVHSSSLPGLIDATRRATAVVGVDSGPLHLAAALGKPGVALFGPTDPARNGPYGGTLSVLRDPQAVTSYRRGASIDPSMRALTPEHVHRVLAPLLVP
jgi:heptosyltransferase-1